MNCTRNPKIVLGMKIDGDHEWHPSHVDKFSENLYRLTEVCSHCGHNRETLVHHYQLLKAGFKESQIARAGYYNKIFHQSMTEA